MPFTNEKEWQIDPDAEGWWVWNGPYSSVENAVKTVNISELGKPYSGVKPIFLSMPIPYPYFGFNPSIPYQELQIYKIPTESTSWTAAPIGQRHYALYFAAMKITDPRNGSDYWFLSPIRKWYSFPNNIDLTPTATHPHGDFWFQENWDSEFNNHGSPSGKVVGLYELLELAFAEPKLLGGWLGRIVTGVERQSQGDFALEGWRQKKSQNYAFANEIYNLYQYYVEDSPQNEWKISLNGTDIWEGKDGLSYFDNMVKDLSKSFEDDVAKFMNPIVINKCVAKNKLREFRMVGEGSLVGETPWFSLKIIEVNFEDTSLSKIVKSITISVNSYNTGANYWDFSFWMMPEDFQNDWKEAVQILCEEYNDNTIIIEPEIDGIGTRPEMRFFPLIVRSLNGIVKTFFSMLKGVLIALPILMLLIGTYMGVIFTLKTAKEVAANGG